MYHFEISSKQKFEKSLTLEPLDSVNEEPYWLSLSQVIRESDSQLWQCSENGGDDIASNAQFYVSHQSPYNALDKEQPSTCVIDVNLE